MRAIREVKTVEVNNRLLYCTVIYEPYYQKSYRYIPDRVGRWMSDKYDHSTMEERGDDVIICEYYREV